jgi:phage shock protein A
MGTKLFDRITTLVKADMHGLLESLEERSLLLKQYVREAEIELDRKRARLEALRDEETRLRNDLAHREAEIGSIDEDVALAMRGGKDDVARFAIRRLIPRRDHARILQAQITQRTDERDALEKRLAVQQERLEDLKTRVRAELARSVESEPPSACFGDAAVAAVAEEEVELELLRRRQQGTEGRS